jgi:peptidoglycan/LPS O-acetylase OafA/YrhL
MSSPSPDVENHRINAIRAVSALAVVVGHLRILAFKDYDDAPHNIGVRVAYGLTALGHQAVIVFFVLSGYWVGGAVLRKVRAGRFTWADYATARMTRLWIVLLPALMLTSMCDWVGRCAFGWMSTYTGSTKYAGVILTGPPNDSIWAFVANALFLQKAHGIAAYGSNSALWSLSYEFWFYVLFPLLALGLTRRRPSSVAYLATALIAAGLIGAEITVYFPMWCLGASVAAAESRVVSRRAGKSAARVRTFRAMSIALVLATSLAVRGINTLPAVLGDYLVAIPATMMLMSLAGTTRTVALSGTRCLSWFSHRSYSLYAIHTPVLVLAVSAIGLSADRRWAPDLGHAVLATLLILATLGLSLTFAAATELRTSAVRNAVRASLRLSPGVR